MDKTIADSVVKAAAITAAYLLGTRILQAIAVNRFVEED